MLRLAAAVIALAAPATAAAAQLPHRPARASDDAPKTAAPWEEDYRVLAFDPAGGGYAEVTLVTSPLPMVMVRSHGAGRTVDGDGVLATGLQGNSISYANGRYTVRVDVPTVQGLLTIVPSRAGVTVGPWHLGPEPVYPSTGQTTVPGEMWWSVPVATGTVSGWLASPGSRLELHDWRAYHDHIWGRFRRSSMTWSHWDFVVKSPRAGEAWILNGLEATKGFLQVQPDDAHWQGVLVHVTPRGVTTCQARIARGGWLSGLSSNTPWRVPTTVAARCGGAALTAHAPSRWPAGGFLGGVGGSAPLPGATGWIEHGMPLLSNTS